MNYYLCFDLKNNLLCLQVLKIHPVFIVILQDEGYYKSDDNIIFGGSIKTVTVHCIEVHGDNMYMGPGLWNSALDTDKRSASRSSHVITST
jgi:hypothetical protein